MPTAWPTRGPLLGGRGRGSSRRPPPRPRSIASSTTSMKLAPGRRCGSCSILRSGPSTLPNGTCTASVGGCSHPAISLTANTIARCCACGAPTTYSMRSALHPLDAIDHARQVAGGVRERAGTGCARSAAAGSPSRLVNPGGNTTSAPSDSLQQPGGVEPLDDLGQQRVVDALAGQVVVGQQHAELARRGRSSSPAWPSTSRLPQRDRLGVAGSAAARPVPGPAPRTRRSSSNSPVAGLVELVEVAERRAPRPPSCSPTSTQVLDQHPERAAPVADVVLADRRRGRGSRACRTSASPMTVVRRCPMCISLATFGAE